jgi:hypothetical protein
MVILPSKMVILPSKIVISLHLDAKKGLGTWLTVGFMEDITIRYYKYI